MSRSEALPSDVNIRRYTPADADVLRTMIAELRAHEISIDPACRPWEQVADGYFDFISSKVAASSGCCWIVEVADEIAGFSVGYEDSIDEVFLKDEEKTFAYVSDTYVKPGFRRHGLARQLNESMERYFAARGVRKMRHVVLGANIAINNMLQQAGYAPYEIIYEKRISA